MRTPRRSTYLRCSNHRNRTLSLAKNHVRIQTTTRMRTETSTQTQTAHQETTIGTSPLDRTMLPLWDSSCPTLCLRNPWLKWLVESAPPGGSLGEPNGEQWNDDKWNSTGCAKVDFNRMEECRTSDGGDTTVTRCAIRAWPSSSTLTTLQKKPSQPVRSPYKMDDCASCKNRPLNFGKEAWLNGTGDGTHHPMYCQSLKRYLAEGGESSNNPEEKAFLQGCLRYVG